MTELPFHISIVIPCYNEEPHLLRSIETIYAMLEKSQYRFEMVLVDDCSTDKTREIILRAVHTFPDIKYLFHEKNTGRGGAFLDGSALAEGKFIGFLDIDLEVSCVYLIPVIMGLENGFDVVVVRRHYALSPDPSFILRHILSIGYKYMIYNFLKIPRLDTESGFKFFKRECLLDLAPHTQNKHWFFDTEIMALAHKMGYKIKEVDGLFIRRKDKKSTVRLFRDTFLYMKELYRFKKRLSAMK